MSKFLIVGLGNIGDEYAHTRHNIGFDVVAAFVAKHNAKLGLQRLAYQATVKWKGRTFVCICPTTFMNRSGAAVRYWLDKEKISKEHMLVIVDDLALPLTKLRLRAAGTDAGHNGLKDIQAILATTEYPRLRFGIGNVFPKGAQVDFVLGKWPKDEWPLVELKIGKCVEAIEHFATIGLEQTMGVVNKTDYTL